jgi:AcrR family transcriptional regulator
MTFVTEPEPDWRQRKKNATRDRIRASALRLFGEQGYDATTVEQIAAAAGVSHMTFFRYFPTKEDVALSDSYDPLLAGLLEQTPAAWPLTERIRSVLVQGLRQVYDTDRPGQPAPQLHRPGHRRGLPGRRHHRHPHLGRERRNPRPARPDRAGLRHHQPPSVTGNGHPCDATTPESLKVTGRGVSAQVPGSLLM